MQPETAILIGIMFTVATYLVLHRSFVRILFGFLILTTAANLFVLSMSGTPDGKNAPVVPAVDTGAVMVDPLPQALILTAIVIGFGTAAYLVFLLYRLFLDQKTTDAIALYRTGPTDEPTDPPTS